ncbi:MAG: HAD family acid phosphatase [Balneolaceae bacterium]
MRISKTPVFLYLLVLATMLIQGCSSTKPVHPTLQATLWVQNAVEFDALASMSYQTAETKLREALMDKSWTAELTQVDADIQELPPAVVLDIDETVLDNSPYQARMVQKGSGYDPVEWEKWVLEANADAISGAVSFTNRAADEGITVIYLSNREANTEEATRKNLEALGFPVSDETDVVLLKNELPEWTSSKVERRKHVAASFRILMLFGDDFNDFLPAKNISEKERDNLLETYRTNFGAKWFILPNPIYGSWDQALYNFERNLSDEEKSDIIDAHLHTKN